MVNCEILQNCVTDEASRFKNNNLLESMVCVSVLLWSISNIVKMAEEYYFSECLMLLSQREFCFKYQKLWRKLNDTLEQEKCLNLNNSCAEYFMYALNNLFYVCFVDDLDFILPFPGLAPWSICLPFTFRQPYCCRLLKIFDCQTSETSSINKTITAPNPEVESTMNSDHESLYLTI